MIETFEYMIRLFPIKLFHIITLLSELLMEL